MLSFEHFQKKDDTQSLCISETTDSQRRGHINVKKVPFQSTLQQETW